MGRSRSRALAIVTKLLAAEIGIEAAKIFASGFLPLAATVLSLVDLSIDIAENVVGSKLLKESKFNVALIIGLVMSVIALLAELIVDIAHDYQHVEDNIVSVGEHTALTACLAFLHIAINIPILVLFTLKVDSDSLKTCTDGDHIPFDNAVVWTSVLAPVIVLLSFPTIIGPFLAGAWYFFLSFIYPIIYWQNECKHPMILMIALTVPSTWSLYLSCGSLMQITKSSK